MPASCVYTHTHPFKRFLVTRISSSMSMSFSSLSLIVASRSRGRQQRLPPSPVVECYV